MIANEKKKKTNGMLQFRQKSSHNPRWQSDVHNLKRPWWDSTSAWFRCHFLPRCFTTILPIVTLTPEATIRFYFTLSSNERSDSDLKSALKKKKKKRKEKEKEVNSSCQRRATERVIQNIASAIIDKSTEESAARNTNRNEKPPVPGARDGRGWETSSAEER